MKVLVSGSSGMVGSALTASLVAGGHEVGRLVRREARAPDEVRFEVVARSADVEKLSGADAIVHLAGHNIAAGRWNEEHKRKVRDSRVDGTRFLCETLSALAEPPRVLVCASAIGYYGDRGDEVLNEQSPPGEGFLPEVCVEWEAACEPARAAGVRVVNLRIGVILDPEGGALAKMLLPFKLGVGGVVGSGRQYWSWIANDDVVGVVEHALADEELSGPVNAVTPNAPTNRVFTKTLGGVLGRPTILPMPAFAARLALGEMADALLLASARVEPAALGRTGYEYRRPELEGALRHMLGK